MNTGDLFEFIDYSGDRCRLRDEFYDETLKNWVSVSTNVFICVSFVKSDDCKDSQWDRSLFFTDGERLFNVQSSAAADIRRHNWYVSSTRLIS